jgi:hypothetical protein
MGKIDRKGGGSKRHAGLSKAAAVKDLDATLVNVDPL